MVGIVFVKNVEMLKFLNFLWTKCRKKKLAKSI
nr:MAG TPA: hypothetical protein [Caudoviricetes sp.]